MHEEEVIEFKTKSGRAVLRRPDLVSMALAERCDDGFSWLTIDIGERRMTFTVSHEAANDVMDRIARVKPEQKVKAC